MIIKLLLNPRIIHSGERQLTCLEDTTVIYKDKTFICRELENIQLGSPGEKWEINLGKARQATIMRKIQFQI